MNWLKEDATGKITAIVSNRKITVLELISMVLETWKKQQPSAKLLWAEQRNYRIYGAEKSSQKGKYSPERQIL